MKFNVTDIFFDLDHTLWDFEKNSALTFQKILKLNKVDVSFDAFIEAYVPINFEYWRMYREERITKEALRYQRLAKTFSTINYIASDTLIHQLAEDYITYLSTYNHLFEHTISILETLSKNYTLHIITNGFHEVQRKKMRNAKIFDYFTHIIDSESVGVKKPNPNIFNHALKLANVLPENALMIGDSLEADIIGALDLGIHAIHVDFDNKHDHNRCPIVHNLPEILDYL